MGERLPVTLFDRGHSLLERRRFKAALDCFNRCIRRGSRGYLNWHGLFLLKALCLEGLRRPEEARRAYGEGLAEAMLQHERSRLPEAVEAAVKREYAALRRWVGLGRARGRGRRPTRRRGDAARARPG
jgi:tetratricopeptide (TPR) repeat protein